MLHDAGRFSQLRLLKKVAIIDWRGKKVHNKTLIGNSRVIAQRPTCIAFIFVSFLHRAALMSDVKHISEKLNLRTIMIA